ncbi:MAG: hypothetical protein B6242_02610 [Anaerolineaceae bacterium 4572_78]|nr:MAG: hypothetical protein B6242_02610 [Anaerolineaceae bacterium 4572_78]
MVCNKLNAFINEVEAKRDKQPNGIESTAADNLISMAGQITGNFCEVTVTPEPTMSGTVESTSSPQATLTIQPTGTATGSVVLSPDECIASQGCFTVEFQGYEYTNGQVRLTFKVTNHCKWDVGYVALVQIIGLACHRQMTILTRVVWEIIMSNGQMSMGGLVLLV